MPLFISVFDMFLCIARNSDSRSFSKGRWEAFQNFGRIYTPASSWNFSNLKTVLNREFIELFRNV